MAADHAKAFALSVYKAYENSFGKLECMEKTLCHLFDTLENEQFLAVLQILSAAADCPIPPEMKAIAYDEIVLDCYVLNFMYDFEDMVLAIGMDEAESDTEAV